MARWIKMPLGMEVDLSPGDFVLDGDPAHPSQKGGGAHLKFLAHVHCGQKLDGSRWHSAWTWASAQATLG